MTETQPKPAGNQVRTLPRLPTKQTSPPRTRLGRWLFHGGPLEKPRRHLGTHPWYVVVWLTGVDYFSSLAYQPGIALLAVGALAPSATLILVAVTLFGALPVYAQVAHRSYAGQGSIAILENLLSGWRSKFFVLVLIGFATTDFVITMTLSAADASRHAIENPYLAPWIGDHHITLTLAFLTLLAVVFLLGFTEAIRLAAAVAIPYIVLNFVVLLEGLRRILAHPDLLRDWSGGLHLHTDMTGVFLASAIVFPKLALGLSGFETGVSVMPLIANGGNESSEKESPAPEGRIANTRKLLALAACLMAVMLLLSSFVTTLLIPAKAYQANGPASGRATAYLAHELLGNAFGSVYDLSTIAILWFAGASAMAGLIHLIPRYLPRFGMAPRWVSYQRPMVLVLFAANVLVTVVFRADVERQGGAYATGVLVLMLSAAVAVTIALWRESREEEKKNHWLAGKSFYFALVSVVFTFTLIANIFERPDGVYISAVFILAVLLLSGFSRYQRSKELRVSDLIFTDDESAALWPELTRRKVSLVPVSYTSESAREAKATEIHQHYHCKGPLAFLHVSLLDNRSEFIAPLRVSVQKEKENFVVRVRGAVAIANSIAYISELIDPVSIFLELTSQNLMMQSLRYLFWGEGETGLMVYSILVRYWQWAQSEEAARPTLYMMTH